jgi:hypothetical protein
MCICRCVPRNTPYLAQSYITPYCTLSQDKMGSLQSTDMLCTRVHTMDTVCACSQFKNMSVMCGGLKSRDKVAMCNCPPCSHILCNCPQCSHILCDCTQSEHASYGCSQSTKSTHILCSCASYDDIAKANTIIDEDSADLSQYSDISTVSIESVFVSATNLCRNESSQHSGISTTVVGNERVSVAVSRDSGISELEGRIDTNTETCPNEVLEIVSVVCIDVDLFPKDTTMSDMYTHM